MNTVTQYIDQYGYWAVFLSIFFEDFGFPLPGEAILITAGTLAGTGDFSIAFVILLAFVAAVLGDNIGYAVGRFGGCPLVERYGKYVFITEQRLVKLRALFARHGDGIIIIARFISGLRQLNGIIAGLARMKWHRFLVFNMIGAALWAGVWGGLSYMLGGSIQRLHRIFRQLEVVLLVLVLLLLVFLMVRLVLKKHKR